MISAARSLPSGNQISYNTAQTAEVGVAWHFRDKDVSFDAKIDDRKFWKRIDEGEAFAGGDRLRVHLQTTARRTPFGRVKVERVIPRVIDVTHIRNRQTKLFEDDGAI
jgi:hypothetical protein